MVLPPLMIWNVLIYATKARVCLARLATAMVMGWPSRAQPPLIGLGGLASLSASSRRASYRPRGEKQSFCRTQPSPLAKAQQKGRATNAMLAGRDRERAL